MKIAYLILAHHMPRHVNRLCKALSSNASRVFVHWDKKAGREISIEPDEGFTTLLQQRIPVYWGDFSMVEAELMLLKAAHESAVGFDRFILMSGSDYPLRSQSYINQFFCNNKDTEFIDLHRMPAEQKGKPISRLTRYKLRSSDSRLVNEIKQFMIRKKLLPGYRDYKVVFEGMYPYAGSAWWALSREAATYVLDFVAERSRFVNYYKHTEIPDESFFHTILGNSEFRSNIKKSLTYTDWSAGGLHPSAMTEEHIRRFTAEVPCRADGWQCGTEVLFARKFSENSGKLISQLEGSNLDLSGLDCRYRSTVK